MVEMEDSGFDQCLDFMLSPQIEPYDKMYPVTPVENLSKSESRRGRPKAAMISSLIMEGSVSKNGIRCDICSRVFPRDKSLQAHRRVHTGERPYICDYPGCSRKFKQSGQLKTHQRLHTGERPFLCSAEGCNSRFTHANRHCTAHPSAPLVRSDDFALLDSAESNQSEEVKLWLIKYRAERREARSEQKKQQETAGGGGGEETSPHRRDGTPTSSLSDVTNFDRENRTPGQTSRKSLFSSPDSPRKRELPKKRWLRIASIEQECLALQNRPTVLRHSSCLSASPADWSASPLSAAAATGASSSSPPPPWASSTPLRDSGSHSVLLTPPHSDERRYSQLLVKSDEEDLAVPLAAADSFSSSSPGHLLLSSSSSFSSSLHQSSSSLLEDSGISLEETTTSFLPLRTAQVIHR